MSEIKTVNIPRVHDKKMASDTDIDQLLENVEAVLESMFDIDDKFMMIIVRNKDQNGEWFFGMSAFALEDGQGKPEGYLVKDLNIKY